ncbi:uncharacterized protein LOC6537345 [Drosophila yakuba]|uniref:DUF4776 domain-containing protein n=1 Tax=Drosophila yakuba TaxID=7245 RepID=B4PTB5_DROYA|nr:uncharacterized protein LOC6537345 [Drosophila yakuba]EDW97614.1 uncharacterized protein Dyak_GE10053 [Drosophila yakuba]
MAESVNFLFDLVITDLNIFGVPIEEPIKLLVDTKVAGKSVKVTSSRINVDQFVANRELELAMETSALRQSLEEKGLALAGIYQGSTLGKATVNFPVEFLDKISPTMNDLLHVDTVDLVRRVDVIGTVSVLIRLTIKCEEHPVQKPLRQSLSRTSLSRTSKSSLLQTKKEKSERVSCASQGPTFNPQDIMFVIGDPDPLLQIPSEPCSELPPEVGDERLSLDLQRYKSLENRRAIFPADDPCPKEKPSFMQLKRLTEQYSNIIDSVTKKIQRMESSSLAPTEPPSDANVPSSVSTPWTLIPTPMQSGIPVPVRSDLVHGVKPTRFCPVCLCSMSWLPKYTPCPKCNTKAVPILQGHWNKPITAEEIVAEQLVRPTAPPEVEDFCEPVCEKVRRKIWNDNVCPPCRCTCTKGITCPHCRIRRMCNDIFASKSPPKPKPRVPQPRSSEDFCVVMESDDDDDLPYLAKVFSELKNLYHIHDTKKLSAIKERCAAQSLFSIRSRRSIKELTESLYPGDKIPHRESHPPKAGHKSCLTQTSIVSRRHGWNWTKSCEARKNGWRPGAILRSSGHVMRHFLMRSRDQNMCRKVAADYEAQQRFGHPVLNICKRNGDIYVTLRPLPTLAMKQKPITFRIVKSHLAVALRQIKRALKDQGFEKCSCHQSLMMCTCRDALDKIHLNKALKKECQKRFIEPCPEHLVLTDTSVSDVEFDLDVTPPAGTRRPRRKALRNVVNHGTQTAQKQPPAIAPPYPVTHNPYYRDYDCAAGDRYMGTAFGDNVETVFEDGVYGYRGGGQHGMPVVWRHPKVWGKKVGAPLPIGTARDALDPYRFTKTVWKQLPRKIIRKMRAKSGK